MTTTTKPRTLPATATTMRGLALWVRLSHEQRDELRRQAERRGRRQEQ